MKRFAWARKSPDISRSERGRRRGRNARRALAAIPATLLAASLSGCLIDQPMLRTPADPAAPATSAVTPELESRLGPLTGPIALKPAATSATAPALASNAAYPGGPGGPATAAASPVATQSPLRTVATDPDETGIAAPHNHGPGSDDVGPLTGPIALNPVKPNAVKPQTPRLSTIAMLPGYDSGSTKPRGDKTDKDVKTTSNLINEPASTGAIQAADTLETIPATQQFAIDLNTSLRLAEVENPQIAQTRAAILSALAEQQAARVLMLPTLNAGVTYFGHTGNYQRSQGQILNVSQQLLYFGGGAGIYGVAGTVPIPAVQIFSPLTDAIFEPLAAKQRVEERRYDNSATSNMVLLDVSSLYFQLLGTEAILEYEKKSLSEAGEILRLAENYYKTGEERKADADRARTEYQLRVQRVQKAEENVAVAAVALSQRLHLDPSIRLRPAYQPFDPMILIDVQAPISDLIAIALQRRPELGARNARIRFNEAELNKEYARPLLPTLMAGFSGGGFGGGSNLVQPLLGRFGGRTDLDIYAYWTLENLGFGNLNIQRKRRAQVGEAVADRSRMINLVRREVTAAKATAAAAFREVATRREGLINGENGFREDLDLVKAGGVTRIRLDGQQEIIPLEAINTLKLLADARVNFIRAVVQNNQAQFALYVDLGSPPPLQPEKPNASGPIPPAPIADPPTPPIAPPHTPLPEFPE